MLYEVITVLPEAGHDQARRRPVPGALAPRGRHERQAAPRRDPGRRRRRDVITSYSIHYTKLYEVSTDKAVNPSNIMGASKLV